MKKLKLKFPESIKTKYLIYSILAYYATFGTIKLINLLIKKYRARKMK